MDEFAVEVVPGAQAVRLVLAGELDLAGAGDLQDAAAAALREKPDALVMDLDGLAFVDSSGIAGLLSVASQARSAGVPVTTQCGPASEARGVIATLGLHDNLGLETA